MIQLADTLNDILHDQSLPTIAMLQQSLTGGKDFMIGISTLFDPRYVFLVYAPILFSINKAVGHRMIIALSLTEWINQILKWLLAGERPYWYVHERNEATTTATLNYNSTFNTQLSTQIDSADLVSTSPFLINRLPHYPSLEQFPVTCELGAGSPSGHAMVSATVWYILIDAFLKNELPILSRFQKKELLNDGLSTQSFTLNVLSKLSWTVYSIFLVLISLSRVYLACHFPHQCLGGAILGIIIARIVADKIKMDNLNQSHFFALTTFMLVSALTTYGLLKYRGFNPLWSVDKAKRWCVNEDYLHMDTTPFFSMMRYLGFCFGSGLAFDQEKLLTREPVTKSVINGLALIVQRIISAGLSIHFGRLLTLAPIANPNPIIYYTSTFLLYTAFSFAIAKPIPKLSKTIIKSLVIGLDNKRKVWA